MNAGRNWNEGGFCLEGLDLQMDQNDVSARALFLADGQVLVRKLDGMGYALDPQPFLVRAHYVSSAIELENDWQNIQKHLLAPESQSLLWISAPVCSVDLRA